MGNADKERRENGSISSSFLEATRVRIKETEREREREWKTALSKRRIGNALKPTRRRSERERERTFYVGRKRVL